MESNASLWSSTATQPTWPRIEADLEVDVAIVGGGITGLTAALLLAEAGKRVVLLEGRALGSGVSNRSTVHMTEIVDTRYQDVESRFGREGARLVAQSSRAAIVRACSLAERLAIACGIVRRPGYLYTEHERDVPMLAAEHEAARRAGLDAELSPSAPLPFPTRSALRLPDQVQLHVARYLAGLAREAVARGCAIHESSRVVAIQDGEPCLVHLEHGPIVRAGSVLSATHAPLNRVFLQTKIAAYRSYVLAYPGATLADGLFWDTEDPYHYFSTYDVDGDTYLVVGGEDHKTGTTRETTERFDRLDGWTRARLDVGAPRYVWSAQVEEPIDGLPFIGENAMSEHVFVATGFSGNGTTFGTIAAMIFADRVLGRDNPWASLYAATRVKPVASAGTYVGENVDFPIHLVSDRVSRPEARSVDEIAPGEGKTVRVRGERLAVYRDPEGALHAVSSVCTHLGCIVKWNRAERTWDCPCHGSRFDVDGDVLDGPATRPLPRRTLDGIRRESGTVTAAGVAAKGRAAGGDGGAD